MRRQRGGCASTRPTRHRAKGGSQITRTSKISVSALAWLTGVSIGASPALASAKIEIKEAGGPPTGAELLVDVALGECVDDARGSVVTNGMPKDKLSFEAPFDHECVNAGYSSSGHISSATVGNGTIKFSMAPKLAITAPGPCVYEFSRLTGHFQVPGAGLETDAEMKGKLNKSASARGCATKTTTKVGVQVAGPVSHRDLEVEAL